ncbi:hypothetical protein I305_05807 [Cryptococcus gattii E566]|uniref:Uncharacterized protein n=2 Tax=Cryptococcus gattii TaxID=37769 RepID=E6RA93_CRYGW|nr:Hypothetical Protein CGB_H0370W [Cryptococcus gattii WM276]ADV23758.1 Hypothetical Protein CGB_H0370W [Cryptococcus gattii WM276]KIR81587.1 hypothetical protein I306_01291 [Cryptococcus gattii EJB2]KIY31843.1 hypothetical protein I305_05807 [Cryptococcus gattii E566]KJE02199.1 hypothetical protein I311_04074 [Cryptococcus gattii NT-10]
MHGPSRLIVRRTQSDVTSKDEALDFFAFQPSILPSCAFCRFKLFTARQPSKKQYVKTWPFYRGEEDEESSGTKCKRRTRRSCERRFRSHGQDKNAALAKATKELERIEACISETRAGLMEAEKGREDTEERLTLLATLQQEEQTSVNLKAELAAFGAADPVRYQKKSEAVKVCKDAAVRWTGMSSDPWQREENGSAIVY